MGLTKWLLATRSGLVHSHHGSAALNLVVKAGGLNFFDFCILLNVCELLAGPT
jgi:hypothetical protein